MALQLKYDASMVGTWFQYAPDEGFFANWTTDVFDSAHWGIPKRGDWFIATGYYYTSSNSSLVWLQTTVGIYISAELYDDEWKRTWNIKPNYEHVKGYSVSQAQALVQKIINNNKDITRCNMLCARYADRFSQTQLAQIKALQQRVMARNKALQDQGLTQNVKTGYPEEYAELSPYLAKIMEDQSIGIATWVVVVIAATVIAATATAAYFAYKSLADESERDVKFSKELTATLVNKLTPEEYQQLINETKGMLTKSKIKSLVKGSWGTLKYVIMGGAALYALHLLKSDRS